jgi:hypothetical protein
MLVVLKQPVGNAYVTITLPALTPFVVPLASIEATDEALLLQEPPGKVLLRTVDEPSHTAAAPEM